MSAMSDYLESGIIDHFLRGQTLSKPGNLSLALCSGVPVDANTGSNIPEITGDHAGGAYVRKSLGAPANATFSIPSGTVTPTTTNVSAIEFAQATADWGYISGVAIVDATGWGLGNVLLYGALTTPRIVTNGDIFRFNAGDIDISMA
tara:strand:- start:1274 stop:1714 length:441 start_codon:yes stop_codon:yes gene_type:complete